MLFGGGYNGSSSNVVDVYDSINRSWSTTSLPHAKYGFAATAVGSDILFAGSGSLVDIYHTPTGTWSTTTIAKPLGSWLAAASTNNKAVFAGGNFTSQASIYDNSTGAWSYANLSQARGRLAAASVGTKVLFGGGVFINQQGIFTSSDVVDIYDTANNSWTTATLSTGREFIAAASTGNKVLFAGGDGNGISNVVDIYTMQNYPTINSSKTFTLVDQTTVAGKMQLNVGASLNLDAYSLTVGSISGVAPINLSAQTLTVGISNSDSSYSGAICGNGAIVKKGDGVLSLSGANSYLGLTTISSGELELVGQNAWNPIVNLGGAYLSSGQLVFDYSGSTDPYKEILSLLGTKINGAWPLNVIDDVVYDRVTVSFAVPEPSTLLLVVVGLMSMFGFASRWRKHSRPTIRK